MTIDTKPLSERLRTDAEEIAGWGAGNEAATVREAADALDAKDALLREARQTLNSVIALDDEDAVEGSDLSASCQLVVRKIDAALLSKLTEATKP
jgi:hypothetical protein